MEFCNGTNWAAFGSGNSSVIPAGAVSAFAGTAAPTGWLLCEGQVISIATYAKLYAVLGATYGGDGVTTFAVPDLRGRVAAGSNPTGANSLEISNPGEQTGTENTTLMVANLPSHSFTVGVQNGGAAGSSGIPLSGNGAGNTTTTTNSRGSDVPFTNFQPTIYLNYIIFTGQ